MGGWRGFFGGGEGQSPASPSIPAAPGETAKHILCDLKGEASDFSPNSLLRDL